MDATERIKRNMQPNKPMTMISLRVPQHIIDDMKEIAPTYGLTYQTLLRVYISEGLRKDHAKRDAENTKYRAVDEMATRLLNHGVEAKAVYDAVAEMKLAG